MAGKNAPIDFAPETDEGYEAARSYLKEHFAAWCAANGTTLLGDAGEAPIHYKGQYLDGHLTAWTTREIDEIYLELHPAKMIVEEDELDSVLGEARAFMTFLDETGLLDPRSDQLEVLLEHLERIEGRFVRNMGDVARYSTGKRFLMAAMADGVELDDHEALESFMAEFNTRKDTREAMLALRTQAEGNQRISGRATPRGTKPRPKQTSVRRRRKGR